MLLLLKGRHNEVVRVHTVDDRLSHGRAYFRLCVGKVGFGNFVQVQCVARWKAGLQVVVLWDNCYIVVDQSFSHQVQQGSDVRGSNVLCLETRQRLQLCYDGTNLLAVKIVDHLLSGGIGNLVPFWMALVFDVERLCNKINGVDSSFSPLQVSFLFDPCFPYFLPYVEHFLLLCFFSYVRKEKFSD